MCCTALAFERFAAVQLAHADTFGRSGLHTQFAEHALIEVLFDDRGVAPGVDTEDVDGADLQQLLGQLCVLRGFGVDLDGDKHALGVSAHIMLHCWHCSLFTKHYPPPSAFFTRSGICDISSATEMPASCSRRSFSAAVSALPSTIVPAWPKRMPGILSMKRPAMKAMIGRRELFSFTQRLSCASIGPPGSV